MIFAIQRSLEDYIRQRQYNDPDNYAISLAKLYDRERAGKSETSFLLTMGRMRTAFFTANAGLQRSTFERSLLTRLDTSFKKKAYFSFQKPSQRRLKRRAAA